MYSDPDAREKWKKRGSEVWRIRERTPGLAGKYKNRGEGDQHSEGSEVIGVGNKGAYGHQLVAELDL